MDHSAPFLTEKNFETPHRFGGHEWNIQALGPYMKRTKKMPMLKRISDFNVLLLSSKVLDPQSKKAICSNVQKQEELEDGYVMILESLGM
jgi:nuclear protein localization family protein 4